MAHILEKIGFVAIGRNEGVRLQRCLNGLKECGERIVYVDSGSTDGSIAFARSIGVEVIELDTTTPFTAARARNAGYEALVSQWPDIETIMFIDGDCEPAQDFPRVALHHLEAHDDVALVTGHCREMFPEKSVYNLMCDLEWRGPLGQIEACGGIFVVRRESFITAGKFNPAVIAAEDDDLCIRLRGTGKKLWRIDEIMCSHDADIHKFSQWWQRSIRAGYAYALVGNLHSGYFLRNRMRAIVWAGILPLVIVLGIAFTGGWSLLLTGLYGVSFIRTRTGLIADGIPSKAASAYAGHLAIARFANLGGMLDYWRKKLTGQQINIVEYK